MITMHPRSFVLNSLGTGKSRAALFAFDYLRSKRLVTKLLIVAPLSTLRVAWQREVTMVFPHLRTRVLHGPKAKRVAALQEDADVYIINYDGLKVLEQELAECFDLDMVVIDELTAYKRASTTRWKKARKLVHSMKWAVGMTGTPTPTSATDAYGQIKLIRPGALDGKSFGRFREKLQLRFGPYRWVDRDNASQMVHQMMQPSVRFTRDDCFDLPPAQYIERFAPLSKEQQAAYDKMAKEEQLAVANGEVTAFNEADKINKLVQISLGVVYTSNHEEHVLDASPRLEVLAELIEESDSKVLVFTPYKSTLHRLEKFLSARWETASVSGDTSSTARDKIFGAFQLTDSPHVIVAHPACMAHGLTLTAASTIVWFGPPLSLELYEQANGRITRAGQKYSQLVVQLQGTRVEEKIFDRLRKRADMQGILLELFEEQEVDF